LRIELDTHMGAAIQVGLDLASMAHDKGGFYLADGADAETHSRAALRQVL